ncbi:MAG: hypothetical protein M1825_002756 [Sarcosagium campestre]|nr:MAG: hypothetical protein M1825_002756 [Sarcosagium campestre]
MVSRSVAYLTSIILVLSIICTLESGILISRARQSEYFLPDEPETDEEAPNLVERNDPDLLTYKYRWDYGLGDPGTRRSNKALAVPGDSPPVAVSPAPAAEDSTEAPQSQSSACELCDSENALETIMPNLHFRLALSGSPNSAGLSTREDGLVITTATITETWYHNVYICSSEGTGAAAVTNPATPPAAATLTVDLPASAEANLVDLASSDLTPLPPAIQQVNSQLASLLGQLQQSSANPQTPTANSPGGPTETAAETGPVTEAPTPLQGAENPCPGIGFRCSECPGGVFCPPPLTPPAGCPCGLGWACVACGIGFFCPTMGTVPEMTASPPSPASPPQFLNQSDSPVQTDQAPSVSSRPPEQTDTADITSTSASTSGEPAGAGPLASPGPVSLSPLSAGPDEPSSSTQPGPFGQPDQSLESASSEESDPATPTGSQQATGSGSPDQPNQGSPLQSGPIGLFASPAPIAVVGQSGTSAQPDVADQPGQSASDQSGVPTPVAAPVLPDFLGQSRFQSQNVPMLPSEPLMLPSIPVELGAPGQPGSGSSPDLSNTPLVSPLPGSQDQPNSQGQQIQPRPLGSPAPAVSTPVPMVKCIDGTLVPSRQNCSEFSLITNLISVLNNLVAAPAGSGPALGIACQDGTVVDNIEQCVYDQLGSESSGDGPAGAANTPASVASGTKLPAPAASTNPGTVELCQCHDGTYVADLKYCSHLGSETPKPVLASTLALPSPPTSGTTKASSPFGGVFQPLQRLKVGRLPVTTTTAAIVQRKAVRTLRIPTKVRRPSKTSTAPEVYWPMYTPGNVRWAPQGRAIHHV